MQRFCLPGLGLLVLFLSCSQVIGSGTQAPPTAAAPVPALADQVWYELNFQTLSPPTLAAARTRLATIRDLGANVLWLMPVQPEGRLGAVGSPYAVADYTSVNPDLGSLEDLRALVTEAHARGLSVVLDWVADHTAWDHPWITAHPEWYQRNAQGQILSPPGQSWTDVAALDYHQAGLRQAMTDAMVWWVQGVGVDGFRCDYADAVPDSFWASALAAVNAAAGSPRLFLAEGSQASQLGAGFQLLYAWNFRDALVNGWKATGAAPATSVLGAAASELAGLPAGTSRLRYSSNHDKAAWDGSTVTLYGGQQGALGAFAAAALAGGVPLVSSGQEVGAEGPISFFGPSPVDWSAHPEVWAEHRRLLALRAAHPALRTGALTRRDDAQVVAFERAQGQERVLVVINPRPGALTWSVPAADQGPWTDSATGAPVTLASGLDLGPQGYRIFLRP